MRFTATGSASRRFAAGIATLALVVLAVGVVVVIGRHGAGDPSTRAAPVPSASTSPTPVTAPPGRSVSAADVVTDGYYAAVTRGDARSAYRLLCGRQRIGYAVYAARIALNARTGTGVSSFRRTGKGTVNGRLAAVPGQVDLANGEATPIVVLLVEESGAWRICSSNLGGVLPGPGTGTAPSPSPSGDTI
jgi:hypothetical protein